MKGLFKFIFIWVVLLYTLLIIEEVVENMAKYNTALPDENWKGITLYTLMFTSMLYLLIDIYREEK